MANKNLHNAKRAKQDEFYTQWVDIEKEMNAYLDYNPDVFKDKTILLPCDDPEWSNFTKYFASRFQDLGIKKLISTSYAPKPNMEELDYAPEPTMFNPNNYDEVKDYERGKILILDENDMNKDSHINMNDFKWEYLEGDGDFRSDEIKALRDEADMVITNPPFSLFREFVAWLVEGDVDFSVIGNMNAVTYKEIFPLIKDNKLWYGESIHSGDREFRVPDSYPLEAAGFRTDDEGNNYIRVKGVRWFTNIQHGRRHEPLPLMTMDDNLRFNNRIINNPNSYKTYDNYDAIEVPVTAGIPSDHSIERWVNPDEYEELSSHGFVLDIVEEDGQGKMLTRILNPVMGVPISFLDKYNPEQFKILGSQRWAKTTALMMFYTGASQPMISDKKTTIKGRETYDRIFIRQIPRSNG